MEGAATEGEVAGLQQLTSYAVSVRQRNAMGWSSPSAALTITTQAASMRKGPSRPMAPTALSSSASDVPDPDAPTDGAGEGAASAQGGGGGGGAAACDSLLLQLPALRGGCDEVRLPGVTAPECNGSRV